MPGVTAYCGTELLFDGGHELFYKNHQKMCNSKKKHDKNYKYFLCFNCLQGIA